MPYYPTDTSGKNRIKSTANRLGSCVHFQR